MRGTGAWCAVVAGSSASMPAMRNLYAEAILLCHGCISANRRRYNGVNSCARRHGPHSVSNKHRKPSPAPRFVSSIQACPEATVGAKMDNSFAQRGEIFLCPTFHCCHCIYKRIHHTHPRLPQRFCTRRPCSAAVGGTVGAHLSASSVLLCWLAACEPVLQRSTTGSRHSGDRNGRMGLR